MARRPAHVPLDVFLNSRLVGVLRRSSTGAIDFVYATEWLDWESTFPISLSLPLREARYVGEAVGNVFENLLPDSVSIRRQVAERVGAGGTDAYSLLAALGHDCVGALQFLPEGVEVGPAGTTEGQPIGEDEIARIIANLARAPLGMGADTAFRISIAGAQEKTALLCKNGSWFKPTGTAATTHILKPQIGMLPGGVDLSNSVENEYLCLKLLGALGVPVAEAGMTTFGGRRTLVVERFDRLWARDGRLLRLPQEDMCQALSVPPSLKYQSEGGPGIVDILRLLQGSDTPEADIATVMRAQILFWMLGATDGHAKNFSLALGPGGRFHLTPLYDVLSAQPSFDADLIPRRDFRLAMSVGTRGRYRVDDIVPRHFLQTAAAAGIGEPLVRVIFADLAQTAEARADAVFSTLPPSFPEELVASLRAAIARRARILADA
ncbi:toxin HipA [Azorhizobium oxalatiphilum]|uniref:Toxin HipA n=1 Tax=Azorhizobium oxalatiphilum TaxID=980631 RepID=A0A917C8X7_9HYPH|nr:type II toxin-antitoxin system HipA family toxin [Azorhizobium oxalatiphilum]GGF78030.1 toxin HipA [Azorhizobium oxalatiphilum]